MYVSAVCSIKSLVAAHAPAWAKALVCTGTLNIETMVTVHAPAWARVVVCAGTPNNASMVTVDAPAWTTVEQRVGSYYPCAGMDEGGGVRRHTE